MISQYVCLTNGLPITYIYLMRRAVCRNHYQRNIAIESLCKSRIVVQQCRPRSTNYCHWLPQLLCHTQGKESRTSLIYYTVTRKIGVVTKAYRQRGITRTRRYNNMFNLLGFASLYHLLCQFYLRSLHSILLACFSVGNTHKELLASAVPVAYEGGNDCLELGLLLWLLHYQPN